MKIFNKKITSRLIIFTSFLGSLSIPVYGADYLDPTIPNPGLPGPHSKDPHIMDFILNTILPNLAVTLIGIAGSASIVMLIIGGIRMLTAYGNDETIDSAKKQVLFGIVGFGIAMLAYIIVSIVTNINFVDNPTP